MTGRVFSFTPAKLETVPALVQHYSVSFGFTVHSCVRESAISALSCPPLISGLAGNPLPMNPGNSQQPTPNAQPPMPAQRAPIGCSMLDIGCWIFFHLRFRGLKHDAFSPHEPQWEMNGPLSLSLSPATGERVPKAGEGAVQRFKARMPSGHSLPIVASLTARPYVGAGSGQVRGNSGVAPV